MNLSFVPDQLASSIANILQASFSSASRLYDLSIEGVQESAAAPVVSRGVNAAGSWGFLPGQTFMVEAYTGTERLHTTSQWSILVLSMDAFIDLTSLLGKVCQLHTALADGTRATTTGLIHQAALIGSEGGLARYRLSLVDWTWMLGQSVASRVWQDTAVLDIAGSIFTRYAPQAVWAVSDEVAPFLAEAHQGSVRSYCVQYRETDLAFVQRLLASEGLSWRMEEYPESPAKHRMVIFADSSQSGAFPEDYSSVNSLGGAGIRFHRGSAQEAQDTIQALAEVRRLPSAVVTLLSTDYKAKSSMSASSPTAAAFGGKNAPRLESYLPGAPYGAGSNAAMHRRTELTQQTLEARHSLYAARSTVRSLRAGTSLTITQAPLDKLSGQGAELNVLSVHHAGINNLPKQAKDSLAQLMGDVPQLLVNLLQNTANSLIKSASGAHNTGASSYENNSESTDNAAVDTLPLETTALLVQASVLGYANQAELISAAVPWRPQQTQAGSSNLLSSLANTATAPGAQTALVVGPNGTESDVSAGDVYTDALNRIRIRLLWEGQMADSDGSTSGSASCWVRVAQRSAGAGMGLQFIPRVGQEVLVQFLGGDMDRPIVTGALYNGQGEGGLKPTPAGQSAKDSKDSNPFESSSDRATSAQGNLMAAGTGGKSPAWFGASHGKHGQSESGITQGGQANSAAQWGIRTQEWGDGSGGGAGSGYNQLAFDDNDTAVGGNQQRIHFKTTHAATELNLGHLIHAADNHRGSLRGQGFELRSDAYGAIRAGAGLHLTTYAIQHSATSRDPAGDNTGALALLKQAKVLTEAFSKSAATHTTVKLASHVGSIDSGKSAMDDKAAPLAALIKMAATQVSSKALDTAQADAPEKSTSPKPDTLPHSGDAILSMAGQGGIALVAGQSLQFSNSETISFMSGQDSQAITGGAMRMHTGQAIGFLAGAVDKGEAVGDKPRGLSLIASKDPIRYEAQSNEIKIQAKELINIQSANAHIDWAAAKSISLSTAGGANITIEGGNITVQCPGKLTVHAAQKTFDGPVRMDYKKELAKGKPCELTFVVHDTSGKPLKNTSYAVIMADSSVKSGKTDGQGRTKKIKTDGPEKVQLFVDSDEFEGYRVVSHDPL